MIHVAVEPKTKVDQDKMGKALFALSEEDPTFQVRTDEDTGQTVISGMGELHLEVIVDRMLREFKVDATVGKPQVAYRETITQPVEKHTYTHKKQTGGSGQYAEVTIDHRAHRPRRRLRVRRQDHRWSHPEGVHPVGRRRHPAVARRGRARRVPHRRRAGDPASTASTTTSTPRRWRSRSPARWPSRRPSARPSRCCSSRSCRSRSSRPTSTWATSSATSTPGAASVGGMDQRGNSQIVQRPRAALGDVRVLHRPALAHPGSGHLLDAVRQLPADAEHRSRKRSSPASAASSRRTSRTTREH